MVQVGGILQDMKHQYGTNLQLRDEQGDEQTTNNTRNRRQKPSAGARDGKMFLEKHALEGVATLLNKVCQLEEKVVYLTQP